ncbi:hypothetical protein M0R72_00935 [Candidatus Pacearchaeota archaeon]|jgi:hypothetical protein|nr:hypothetical protein [Candidatus Pacearchaeota archaeon]
MYIKDTKNHPVGTTYTVLVPAHAARRRDVSLDDAISALQTMESEGLDAVMHATFPDGTRVLGCVGDWMHWVP